MARTAACLAFILGCLAASTALAAEPTPALELYATPLAVGIEVSVPPADAASTSAEFVWRKAGEDKWHNGVDMTSEPRRGLIWASIWPLEEGQRIEVRVTLKGAAGAPRTLDGSVTTRKLILESPGGAAHYVSPAGSDSADGSKGAPGRRSHTRSARPGPAGRSSR